MMLHTGVPTIRNNILSYETRIMKTTVVRSAERVDELTIHFVFCIHARFTKMKKREIKKNNSFNTRRAVRTNLDRSQRKHVFASILATADHRSRIDTARIWQTIHRRAKIYPRRFFFSNDCCCCRNDDD